jgi:hypothetical protein
VGQLDFNPPTRTVTGIMRRERQQRNSFSVGQLADRWGVSVERVRALIRQGLLPGSFRIPLSGRSG